MRRRFGSRRFGTVLVAGVALLAGVSAVQAQDRWWESFPGFGAPDQRYRTSNEDARRKPEPLNDLRSDATPLRSDVMVEALEGAIRALPGDRRQRRLAADPRLPHDPRRG